MKRSDPIKRELTYKEHRRDGVKLLVDARVEHITEVNDVRARLGMRKLVIKVRNCLACGLPFESVGARLCGCNEEDIATMRHGDCG